MTQDYLIELLDLLKQISKKLGKFEPEIPFGDNVPGYVYVDDVISIIVDEYGDYMEVMRQNTGEIIVDIYAGILKRSSTNIIYLENHIKYLMDK
jgi:hypothetical protein